MSMIAVQETQNNILRPFVQALQGPSTSRPDAGQIGQSARLSSQVAAPTHVQQGTSDRDMPSDACMQDAAGSGLEGAEGSICHSASPTWASTIPDGCDEDVTTVSDEVCSRSCAWPSVERLMVAQAPDKTGYSKLVLTSLAIASLKCRSQTVRCCCVKCIWLDSSLHAGFQALFSRPPICLTTVLQPLLAVCF